MVLAWLQEVDMSEVCRAHSMLSCSLLCSYCEFHEGLETLTVTHIYNNSKILGG